MILPVKRNLLVFLISVAAALSAGAQQSHPAALDNTGPTAKPGMAVTAPKVLHTSDPKSASHPGNSPTVNWLVVATDGSVHDAKVAKLSGSAQADANALDAVKQWRFKPAMKNDLPVKVQINLVVNAPNL
jgi:TonB family protein